MSSKENKALELIYQAKRDNLTSLNLTGLSLKIVPPELFELTDLTKLDLGNNNLTDVPKDILLLKNLRNLNLGSNSLTKVPNSIGGLKALKSLRLASNYLLELPKDVFGNLTELETLNIHDNKLIDHFPEAIFNLPNLKRLYFGGTNLSKVPNRVKELDGLEELNLSYNKFTSIHKSIFLLSSLKYFSFSGNKIKTIPDEIENLKNLEELNLNNSGLITLPAGLGKLTRLEFLELDGNNIKVIPESICKLTNLRVLSFEDNNISELPDNIGNLISLENLRLNNNDLAFLPSSILNLKNIEEIYFRGNNFELGLEVFDLKPLEQIQEILNWQQAQKEGTLKPIHEAKIIFIGESNYGKTHLIEFLRKGKIKRKINTTHGIERSQIAVPYEVGDIRLNIWDLGGQEFMRSTHQFFFSERTLYVLVTLARRERNELNHWLKLVNQLGNKAPVLVVINKIDIDPHDLDRKSLERDYPNIIGFIRTTIKDCDESAASKTLELLKEKISAVVSDKEIMPSVFEQRPPEWFTVKAELEKLESKGKDFITYDEYENLPFIKGLSEDDRKRNLKLLSMIGSVVSFVDDPRLIDTNVINPQWIMNGVYAIINDPLVKDENKGRLHIEDLGRILPRNKFPKGRHVYLLELMEKFNLCYPAKDQRDIYFIPDLFDDVEPDSEWESEEFIHFRYNYDDFSPDAFMTRFIVEMYQDIEDDKRWRSGVFITNGTCRAKVYQAYRKNYINIEIIGDISQGRSYLYAIREVFRKLHNPFPQMEIMEEVEYKNHWLDYLELIELEKVNETKYHTKLRERLPVTDILNGYTSLAERKGELKIIKIFLASSYELKTEREQFEIFINRENNQLVEKGVYLKLELWEDFIDAMSRTRLQDEYNYVVKNCDIFISLFFTKVGKYTKEEFETAFGEFEKNGKPLIYTYFKNSSIETEKITKEIKTLLSFKKRLEKLGHFRTVFKDMNDLKFQFKKQLDKILPSLTEK